MNREKAGRLGYSSDIAALVFLMLMVLWFNHEMVWTGKIPFFRDLGPYFYPMRFNLAMSFQSGELPLWNRHVAMGYPLMANFQSGAFYLPHLTYLFLPLFDGIRFLFVFHYLVAATGTYALCRRWNYPPYLALVGAILFVFGGMTVSLSNMLDHFQSAVWLPWVLFFGEKSIRERSWGNFLLLTSVGLLQFLAGSPEIYCLSLGLLLLDGIRLATKEADVSIYRVLIVFLGANVLVAGLAMVQVLPTLELLFHSPRFDTIPYANATFMSLTPLSLVNLFFLDKEVNPDAFLGLRLFFGQEPPWIIGLYMGAIALPGMCLWFVESTWREKTFLLGFSFLCALLAVGDSTPLYAFMFEYVPLFGLIRFPAKFFFITSVLILFASLTGLFRFLQSKADHQQKHLLALALPLLLICLIYLVVRLKTETLIQFIASARQTPATDITTINSSVGAIVNLERQIWLTLGISALLFLWKTRKLRSSLLQVLLVAVTFFDLSSAHRPYQFLLDRGVIYQNARVIGTPDNEPYRVFFNYNLSYLHPNYFKFSDRPFAHTVSSVFANLLPNTGVFDGFDYMQELDALGRKPYNLFIERGQSLPPGRLYRLLGVLNVKYLISLQPLPSGEVKLLRHFPEYPSWLYRDPQAVPRTYIVSKVLVEIDPSKILERLTSAEFDPLKEAILEQPLAVDGKNGFRAEARIINYTNSRVAIRASLTGSGILVLADSFYPGWEVHVDGKEKEILRTNFFFRGVLLEAGEHLVEFQYRPRSFTIGLAISLITLCGVTGWSIFCVMRRNRRA